jgi:dienelactone hydrolase
MMTKKYFLHLRFLFGFMLIAFCFQSMAVQIHAQEELDVVSDWLHYTDVENSLYHHLAEQAYDYLEQRQLTIETLNSEADWLQYQKQIQETFQDIIGPFPEKTPLKPRITGTLDRPDFTVEKIVYQSRPDFYVTAVMMLPKNRPAKSPAVIYTSGHTENGFRSDTYQTVMINLVKKGFIVFAFDPVGQGERLQYLNEETGSSDVGGATSEHSYAGAQCFLAGSSLAKHMIWDGIRAVDYLLSRDEVDPDRIGITGRSGGGTQSSYIAAMDDRIYASAPENYITSMEYLLKSIGPQDAEQNFYHGIASEIDHPDLLIARAPKPTLLIATTRDFFSIQGVRNTFTEVQNCYNTFEQPDNIELAVDDYGHGSTESNREAMYAFFRKHLNNPGSADDVPVDLFSEEELQVTKTGQVATSFVTETAFSLNAREAEQSHVSLRRSRKNSGNHLQSVKRAAADLSGYAEPISARTPVFTGRFQRDGYSVEKYFIQGEGEYPVPYLVFEPEQSNGDVLLYLHPEGKLREAGEEGEIVSLIEEGYTVIAPDLIGIGETGPGLPRGDSYISKTSYNKLFGAVLIGRSIAGIRAGDISRLILSTGLDLAGANGRIILLAKGTLTPVALHAAAFNPDIAQIILEEPLISYHSLAVNKRYNPEWVHSMVPGALQQYDLPDLAALIAPRKLLYLNPVDHEGEMLSGDPATDKLNFTHRTFRDKNASEHFEIRLLEDSQSRTEAIIQWLK